MVGKSILDEQLEACSGLVGQGTVSAINGLAQMVGKEIQVESLKTRVVSAQETAELVGGREAVNVGVYLTVTGSGDGHMFLMFSPGTALELIDMLLDQPPGTTQFLDEMEESAMAEMGNIMGSFFLNALADAAGLELSPSPPAVMMDMAGAILDVACADIMAGSDEVILVETKFGTADRVIDGTMLVMPSPELLALLRERLRAE